MIQDIYPDILDNSYSPLTLGSGDFLLCFDREGRLLVNGESGAIRFPTAEEAAAERSVYGFSVNEDRYFIALSEHSCKAEGFEYFNMRGLRDRFGGTELFAAFTAYHLWRWYDDNRCCGKCGTPLGLHGTERALLCPECGYILYPRINPAVIVGVIKGDSLLITRYNRGYAHNALVAGFTEIGETLEQTVSREVMEETGVRVKNIRYYKSQPWGMAQDILVGFYCEAEGSGKIHMDKNELKYAEWVKREDIVLQPNNFSLTNEMMRMFRDGLIKAGE
ncbi:MAG: NAD(+) diphosphatase [Ruminococcus sp.]|nr:NAD(+) diphosphatase [Ruminococcus sp.]